MVFQNRKHAGQLLGKLLQEYEETLVDPLVLALPRGGVPVAAEIAKTLSAPLDVLVVRKIGAPFNSELAVGALCENSQPSFSEHILSQLGLRSEDLNLTVLNEKREIQRQIEKFRAGQPLPPLRGRTLIVVDDGLATGATMTAAVKYLRTQGPAKILVAVPVSASRTARALRSRVDEVFVVEESEDLMSVGQWYRNFAQVEDDEVMKLLKVSEGPIHPSRFHSGPVEIDIAGRTLEGELTLVPDMKALIVFAHGSGSSRKSPRNQLVAQALNAYGFGTLLFDLLSEEESEDRENVFDIPKLSDRLVQATRWLRSRKNLKDLPIGYFGASTGAAAALTAAAKPSIAAMIFSVVSRGGRPDLAKPFLNQATAPVLLLVGSHDEDVLELNRQAQSQLQTAKLSVIHGASHLFAEPGALEEVSRQAAEWFTRCLESQKSRPVLKGAELARRRIEDAIESKFVPVKQEEDWQSLIDCIKNKRIVMLGESTHGTQNFYQIRRLLSQRLIKEHGFKFIAVEGDWPEAYRLHRYIQTGEGNGAQNVLLKNHRWPTWMWANREIIKLADWMRKHKAGFFGLDIYSLFESIEEIEKALHQADPELLKEVRSKYACFKPFDRDEIAYARSLIRNPAGCEQEVVSNLQEILSLRLKHLASGGEELFSLQQNARIVANAESYYRAMMVNDANSWNIRDGHMLETLDALLDRYGEDSKAIVWAHNTHIGDYRGTDMASHGYVNIGGLARKNYGAENVALVGFGTYQGRVVASRAWGASEEIMPLPEARLESYEHCFHQAAKSQRCNEGYVLLQNTPHNPLGQTLGHRAVGVVYDPLHEQRSNYVPTELSERYDAFVFVDQSQALQPLQSLFTYGEFPETWPSGQ